MSTRICMSGNTSDNNVYFWNIFKKSPSSMQWGTIHLLLSCYSLFSLGSNYRTNAKLQKVFFQQQHLASWQTPQAILLEALEMLLGQSWLYCFRTVWQILLPRCHNPSDLPWRNQHTFIHFKNSWPARHFGAADRDTVKVTGVNLCAFEPAEFQHSVPDASSRKQGSHANILCVLRVHSLWLKKKKKKTTRCMKD